ncbi:hypothetical protein [Thauera sp.]|uniref:hypothetical protein n=1 Tax=Thauera sp. TaxID=1905334 RepID=UPI002B64CD69|nr:hypothetical protein [Thauera sp.]HRP25373.1 hypothetical protein [Thauera sp.]
MHTQQLEAFGYDAYGNAPDLLAPKDAEAIENGSWQRADQHATCEHCGLFYRQHPEVQGARWLRRTCRAGLVKL